MSNQNSGDKQPKIHEDSHFKKYCEGCAPNGTKVLKYPNTFDMYKYYCSSCGVLIRDKIPSKY